MPSAYESGTCFQNCPGSMRVPLKKTLTVYKPVSLCNGVKNMFAERLCRDYTNGMFGVPLTEWC